MFTPVLLDILLKGFFNTFLTKALSILHFKRIMFNCGLNIL